MQIEKEPPQGGSSMFQRLKTTTILSSIPIAIKIPGAICDLIISAVERTQKAPQNEGADVSDHEAAKNRFNRLRSGIEDVEATRKLSIGEQFGTMPKALTAYWMEKKWESGYKTASVLGLGTLSSANMVWLAQATGRFTDSFISYIGHGASRNYGEPVIDNIMVVGAFGMLAELSSYLTTVIERSLKRDMTDWVMNKFNDAVLEDAGIMHRLTHNKDLESKDQDIMPDEPAQRVMNAAWEMPGGLLNVATGMWSTITTSVFVTVALFKNSVPVDALETFADKMEQYMPSGINLNPGDKGTFLVALAALATFGLANYPLARKFSKKLEASNEEGSKVGGQFFRKMYDTYDKGTSIAASKTHNTRRTDLSTKWKNYSRQTVKDNALDQKFSAWKRLQ